MRLRDKISFFFGVMNVLTSALLLGFAPTWIPAFYSIQVCSYLPIRIYSYKQRAFHYFLFDLCVLPLFLVAALILLTAATPSTSFASSTCALPSVPHPPS